MTSTAPTRGGLALNVQVGDDLFGGRLPYLPRRIALNAVFREAAGLDDGELDATDLCLVYTASIGLVAGSSLGLPGWRSEEIGRCFYRLGEATYEELLVRGYTADAIIEAGRAVFGQIMDSIPTPKEVAAERANFPSLGDSSTSSISASG